MSQVAMANPAPFTEMQITHDIGQTNQHRKRCMNNQSQMRALSFPGQSVPWLEFHSVHKLIPIYGEQSE